MERQLDCLYRAFVSEFPEYEFKYYRSLGIIIMRYGQKRYDVMQFNPVIEKITSVRKIEITSKLPYSFVFVVNKEIEIHFNYNGRSSHMHDVSMCLNEKNYMTRKHIMDINKNAILMCNNQYYDWEGRLIKPIPHKLCLPNLDAEMIYYFADMQNALQLTNHTVLQAGYYVEGNWTEGVTAKYGFDVNTLCKNDEEYIIILSTKDTCFYYLVNDKECITLRKVFNIKKELADNIAVVESASSPVTAKVFGGYNLFYSNGAPYDQYDVYRLGDDYFTYFQNNYVQLTARKPDAGKHTKIAIRAPASQLEDENDYEN